VFKDFSKIEKDFCRKEKYTKQLKKIIHFTIILWWMICLIILLAAYSLREFVLTI